MGLADIQQHIKSKSAETIAEIERTSAEELKQLQSEWDSKIAAERERVLEEANRTAQAKLSQVTFKIREKGNREVLNAKQSVIDEVYENARESLKKLSDSNYESLLVKLLKSVGSQEGTLYTSKERHAALVSAAKKAGLSASVSNDAIDTAGGFLFQGTVVDLDNTFETLLERLREETLIKVNEILFQE